MWRCHLGCRCPAEPVWSGEAAPLPHMHCFPEGQSARGLVLTGLSPLRVSAKENVLQKRFVEMADIGWALWAGGLALPYVCSFQTQAERQWLPQTTSSPSGAETRLSQLRTSSLPLFPTFHRHVSRPSPGPQGRDVHSVHGRL